MAKDFRSLAGKVAKSAAGQARERGVLLSLSDEESRSFISDVVEPGERLDVHADLQPHHDCPKVPRKRRVEDGFGGKTPARKMAVLALNIASLPEWLDDSPDNGRRRTTALHGGPDSTAGRLRIEYDPVTSGCQHVMALTSHRLMLVRVRSGVGRKLGPAIVPWWVHRAQVTASRHHNQGDFSLAFADHSWIRLCGGDQRKGEALRACFPDAPGPWPGDK